MSTLSGALRASAALALLLIALVELLRFLAALAAPLGLYTTGVHFAIALVAGLAGIGLWRRMPWAPAVIVGLGIVFAAMLVIDALVLGIRPWLFALLGAAAALVAALLVAAWARTEARPLT